MPDYVSPGGAFSGGFNDMLLQQGALQRQAMLDDLTRRKAENEIALGQAALQEKRQEHADTLKEKERNQTLTDVAGLVPGDIPDADLVARAQKHHVPLRTTPDVPAPIPPEFGQTATDVTGGVRFAGSPAFAAAEAQRKRGQAFIDSLPDSDPRKIELKQAFEAENAGLKVPPGYFSKTAASGDEAIFRQSPTKGTVERLQNGAWVTWNGDVPRGAHFMTEPAAKDTSAKDAAKDRQLQTTQEHAYAELNKWATPIQGHLDAIRDLGVTLNAKTPAADRLVAPLVIKATIAGQGSGFRMTRAEIENVVGGRSHWESLEAALQQWSLDNSKALSLTDDQRDDLRALTRKIRDKATKLSQQITTARHTIDDATDVKTVNRARTRLQEDLATMDEDTSGGASGGGKRIVYGMDGKPLGQ